MAKSRERRLEVKRIYQASDPADGLRVLVDRVWPRGMSKEEAEIDLWLKDIAPSNDLRKWFDHEPARWDEFRRRYFKELDAISERVDELRRKIEAGKVTLLFGARDEAHNNAVALCEYLVSSRSGK